MGLNSCLYECVIVHRRLRPKRYAFEHRIMMLYADLDELPTIDRSTRLLSHERRNLYSFRDADYLPTGAQGPLKSRVIAFLRERGIPIGAAGRVRLLTLPRILGYIFNPISIYFCSDEHGHAAVRHRRSRQHVSRAQAVPAAGPGSPTVPEGQPMPSRRDFACACPSITTSRRSPVSTSASTSTCGCPGATLQLHIEDWDADGKLLDSHLRGGRVPLSDYQLLRLALKFPALTLKVITLIHWHALMLAIRGVRWHRKADRPELQRDVLNPSAAPGQGRRCRRCVGAAMHPERQAASAPGSASAPGTRSTPSTGALRAALRPRRRRPMSLDNLIARGLLPDWLIRQRHPQPAARAGCATRAGAALSSAPARTRRPSSSNSRPARSRSIPGRPTSSITRCPRRSFSSASASDSNTAAGCGPRVSRRSMPPRKRCCD